MTVVATLMVEYRKWPTRVHYRTTMTTLGDGLGRDPGRQSTRYRSRPRRWRNQHLPTDAVTSFPPDRAGLSGGTPSEPPPDARPDSASTSKSARRQPSTTRTYPLSTSTSTSTLS
jgi:hypothetical protein